MSNLSTFPGSQIEGINQQGIEISKDFVMVNIDFIDATGLYFDPTIYSVTVTKDGNPYTLAKQLTPLSRSDDTVGVWKHSFLTTGMTVGSYVITYSGATSTIPAVVKTLTFTAADIPIEQYFINALRAKLGDKRASRYMVDDNMRTRWTDADLHGYISNALIQVGQAPPSSEMMSFEQGYAEAHDHILTGGFIQALEAMGIFETFNKINYSDELTMNIDRSAFYQNAQSLRQQWWAAVLMWKRDRAFHAIKPIGMGSGRFPAYFSRCLSLSINNAAVTFGG